MRFFSSTTDFLIATLLSGLSSQKKEEATTTKRFTFCDFHPTETSLYHIRTTEHAKYQRIAFNIPVFLQTLLIESVETISANPSSNKPVK